MVSRSFQKASAWASLAAITASPMMPCSSAAPSSRSSSAATSASAIGASSLRPARARRARPASGGRVPGMCLSTSSSESCGTSSKPSTLLVRASRKRSSVERARRAFDAGPGDRARGDRRDQPQRDGGDHAERPLGADQQLVEAVAAIVLLEARQAVVDATVGQHGLDARRPARASSRTSAPGCRRRWSRSARRSCSCRARRASAESACRSRARRRAAWRGSRRPRRPRAGSRRSIERMRFIRRSDSSSAEPSAGGVAPAAMPVLPPCGTSGTRCSAASLTIVDDLLGRGRREHRRRGAVDPAAPVARPTARSRRDR